VLLLFITGGFIVNGGMTVSLVGMEVTGGLTVNAGSVNILGGMTVRNNGVQVLGGLSVLDSGVTLLGGLTINTAGVTIADGTSINAGGLFVTGGLTVNGDTNLQTTPTIFSDRRLKTNIEPVKDSLEILKQIRGVYYHWIQPSNSSNSSSWNETDLDEEKIIDHGLEFDSNRHVGLIAQEVQAALPEVVSHMNNNDLLGVRYGDLIPVLIEAVKGLDDSIIHSSAETESESESNSAHDIIIAQRLVSDLQKHMHESELKRGLLRERLHDLLLSSG
jgi:hypothetical protein